MFGLLLHCRCFERPYNYLLREKIIYYIKLQSGASTRDGYLRLKNRLEFIIIIVSVMCDVHTEILKN